MMMSVEQLEEYMAGEIAVLGENLLSADLLICPPQIPHNLTQA
jgi:hypothetical protein